MSFPINLCTRDRTSMKFFYNTLFIIFITGNLLAQEDTSKTKQLDEVVITATRTERKLGNVAVPVQLISNKIIQRFLRFEKIIFY